MNIRPQPPILCLSDSQLLFWKRDGELFLKQLLRYVHSPQPKAAYIGASNGDIEEFFELFVAAMEGIGITDCRMIKSSFDEEDEHYLSQADIVLLAGGDVLAGWQVFEETGMKQVILERQEAGALLIGVSAGAIQLGMHWRVTHMSGAVALLPMLKLLPFTIDVHDEKQRWRNLKDTVSLNGKGNVPEFQGYGIPSGGGLFYFPDGTVQAIRHDLVRLSVVDGELEYEQVQPLNEQLTFQMH
ncbi:Type 1 glutamine amidotransferase-like domain-containing protein [Paraneptunicella aestuarii]|uniref:Type 1 glutamine amidotransferase-like domain-containing protein n=1 Tax=Paraneptunicella aestuarii TaxID=2831148 RepID=UPI001E414301|nr:Type 1 glutamine amidotransferase-like domain-containing protein [Paraneptunicella aestuarii]UAA37164.1 Type 1 glutamine amidotransferase-like domain-containing protein [Paraneptunicella aestuarii]